MAQQQASQAQLNMDALSYEPEQQRRAYKDPVFLKNDKILGNLLEHEDKYAPSSTYMKNIQTDVQLCMRKILTQWMLEVCQEQAREPEVFLLACNYLDRYLSQVPFPRSKLQLLGTTCMFIASKLKDSLPMNADMLVIYTDNSITFDELRECELTLLLKLGWDMSAITPADFLDLLLARVGLSDEQVERVRIHAQTFIYLCAIEYQFIVHPPSMIASASISCVAKAFYSPEVYASICANIHKTTGIDLELLHNCEDQIRSAMDSMSPPEDDSQSPPDTPTSPPDTPTDIDKVKLTA